MPFISVELVLHAMHMIFILKGGKNNNNNKNKAKIFFQAKSFFLQQKQYMSYKVIHYILKLYF